MYFDMVITKSFVSIQHCFISVASFSYNDINLALKGQTAKFYKHINK